ncbi:MAG TPA: HAD family hydrolase [Nannocystis exedens]|nr:HAD family hydrolase [Nannocystis exedens]
MSDNRQVGGLAGVVFDLDGTLYDKRVLERFVIRRLPWSLARLYRYTRTRSSLAGVDCGSWQALQQEALRRLSARESGQARWRRWIDERYDPAVREGMSVVRARVGVNALLGELRAAGLRLGLVSDYRGIDGRLRALGIDREAFDLVLSTEDRGAMKPARRIVELTLAGMRLPGEAMIMVGDRVFSDQRFAEAAGMEFVGIMPCGSSAPNADPCWRSWSAARAYLLRRALGSMPA